MRYKAYNVVKNPKYDGHQRALASVTYKFFDKKNSASLALSETLTTWNKFAGGGIINENISKKELPEEIHRPIIRKFKKV